MFESVMVQLVTAQAAAPEGARGIVEIMMDASGVVMGVMVILLILSLVSWYIIGYKALYLRRANAETSLFLETFWQSKRLDAIYQSAEQYTRSPVAQVFKAGYIELSKLKNQDETETMQTQLGGI